MNTRQSIGMVAAAAGGLLIAASGLAWVRHTPELKRLGEARTTLEDSIQATRTEMFKTAAYYKAFQTTQSQAPDTLRRYGGKRLMEIGSGYSKKIRTLEMRERDLRLQVTAARRRADRLKANAVAVSVPLGGAGVIALIAGLVLARTARARPG